MNTIDAKEEFQHNLRKTDMQYFHLPLKDDLTLRELGLTIVHPFYNERERFDLQWKFWKTWSDKAKQAVSVIIADDHSDPPVSSYIQEKPEFDLKVYRACKDLRYNTPGCLNMGIKEATTEWVLIMDSDCLLEANNLDWLLDLRPGKDWVYRFHRDRVTNRKTNRLHMILGCSILFSKTAWKEVGGFDEDFTGEYSGGYSHFDNMFNYALAKAGYRMGVPTNLWIKEYLEDMFERKNIQTITGVTKEKEHNINKHLYYDKRAGRKPRSEFNAICRFDYERIL